MNDSRPIQIAILAPLTVDKLDAAAEQAHRTERPFGDVRHPWELRAGSGAYSALFTRERGTESSEWTLAESLSQTCNEPVYSVWLDPEYPRMIYELRGGKKVGERRGDPIELARTLGVDLSASEPPAGAEAPTVVTVAVVDGIGAAEVGRLLGGVADEGWLQLTDVRGSTILSAPDGDLRSAPWALTDALSEHEIYFIYGDRARRELSIQVLRGGSTIGTFYSPPVEGEQTLSTIKGAKAVSAILDALGVAPEQFPRDGWANGT